MNLRFYRSRSRLRYMHITSILTLLSRRFLGYTSIHALLFCCLSLLHMISSWKAYVLSFLVASLFGTMHYLPWNG